MCMRVIRIYTCTYKWHYLILFGNVEFDVDTKIKDYFLMFYLQGCKSVC